MNIINLKKLHNHGGICNFDKKFDKYCGEKRNIREISASKELSENLSLSLILKTRVIIDTVGLAFC